MNKKTSPTDSICSSMSRRDFLVSSGCAAMSSIPALSTLLNLGLISGASAQTQTDYKALVCVFLLGGSDSYNILTPSPNSDAYSKYVQSRGGLHTTGQGALALPANQLIPLNHSSGHSGIPLALHYRLPRLAAMFGNNLALLPPGSPAEIPVRASIIANVGTLLREGTNSSNFQNPGFTPYGLFSHSDQILQWQTTLRDSREATGWAGLMMDLYHSNSSVPWAANIAMGLVNEWQTGDSTPSGGQGSRPFVLNGNSVEVLQSNQSNYGGRYPIHFQNVANQLFSPELRQGKNGIFSRVFHDMVSTSVQRARLLKSVIDEAQSDTKITTIRTIFNGIAGPLSLQLKNVAELMVLRDKIDGTMSRQTFYTTLSGWDHHDEVINKMDSPGFLQELDVAIFTFFRALKAVGLHNKVTLFTASDFGRTLRSNNRGSDHAWGGNMFVVGGSVIGGKVFGSYPQDLANLNNLEAGTPGHGRIIPTTSVDQYFATMARWMGISQNQLTDLFPSLESFNSKTLGFL